MKRDCLDLWVKLYVAKIVMDESTFVCFHFITKMFFNKWMGASYLLELIVYELAIVRIEAGLDGLHCYKN